MLGSKLIKAIAVRPSTKVAPADPPAVLAAARDLRARSFGPATAKYRELGTLANLLAFNAIATLPTRNFQAATFAEAPRAGRRGPRRGPRRRARQLRLVLDRLRAHLQARRRRRRAARGVRERVRARARCAASSDPDAVLRGQRPLRRARPRHHLRRRDDRLGHGVRRARSDRRAVAALRRRRRAAARHRRDRRARGPRRAAGGGLPRRRARSSARARRRSPRTSRGSSCPGYEPRTLQAMALGLAVNARGADHNRSGAYEADLSGAPRPPERRRRPRRGRDRDRGPRGGDGLAHPVQVPARRVRGSVPGVGAAAQHASPAGTSTARSSRRRPAGSCWPSARSTNARDGPAPTTACPSGSSSEPLEVASGRSASLTARAPRRDDRGLLRGPRAGRGRPAQRGSDRRPAPPGTATGDP